MGTITNDRRLLVKAAKLYYFEGMTQAQIAKHIGVSRPIISKMITKAKDDGIIEIFIKDESAHTVDLELEIEKKYGLKEVIIAPGHDYNYTELLKILGQLAAIHVSKRLSDIHSIGISWGKSVSNFVEAFPFAKNNHLHVVPLIGGMGRSDIDLHSNILSLKLAQKLQASASYLYAPAMVQSKDVHQRLIESEDIKGVLEEGKNVDIAVIGIGNPTVQSTMEEIGYLSDENIVSLKAHHAVADINSFFLGENGTLLDHPLNDSIIGVDLTRETAIKETVAIASGDNKIESIHVALRNGAVDCLLTDDRTAQMLVDKYKNDA